MDFKPDFPASSEPAVVIIWLEHIGFLSNEIKDLESRIADMRQRLSGLGYDPSSMSGSSVSDKIPEGIVVIEGLEEKWADKVKRNAEDIDFAREACCSAGDGGMILWMRYVERKRWTHIAQEMGYSRSHSMRMAKDAASSIRPLVPEDVLENYIPDAQPGRRPIPKR